jgi:hypothetical protein
MLYLISVDNENMIYSGGDTPEDAIKAVEFFLGYGREYTIIGEIE